MGLIDFVKSAGERLAGIKDDLLGKDEETDRQAAVKVIEVVNGLGIPSQDLAVSLAKDVATVTGTVESQADRERIVLVVGNTRGVAQVDDQLVVQTPEPEATFYTVKSGDSLSKIARAHYGDAMKYPVIFEANRPMLADPDKIYPGQVLRIPPEA